MDAAVPVMAAVALVPATAAAVVELPLLYATPAAAGDAVDEVDAVEDADAEDEEEEDAAATAVAFAPERENSPSND